MKTQLLEDIDQAATLSLVPSGEPAHSAAPVSAPAPAPRTLKPRCAFGVIDPTKVTRTALVNAASVAGLLLTTEAMIAEKRKSDDE